jgi:CDP-diacylglycerol---serine O-phosphatidyltransferase
MARFPRIPDLLTTANLACGVGSILLASQGQLTWACWLVFAGALFDVFDGLAARALGGGTPLGAQLDSLADMVTFGVAPGMVVFMLSWHLEPLDMGWSTWSFVIIALTIPIASAWRLAKFNIDARQTTGFLGLPTPANALFWASTVIGIASGAVGIDWPITDGGGPSSANVLLAPALFYYLPHVMLCTCLILSTLMLSELPLPSLKFKHFKWKGNEVMLLLMGIGVVLVVLYGVLAVPMILVLYLLSPLWGRLFPKAL